VGYILRRFFTLAGHQIYRGPVWYPNACIRLRDEPPAERHQKLWYGHVEFSVKRPWLWTVSFLRCPRGLAGPLAARHAV